MLISPLSSLQSNYLSRLAEPWTSLIRKTTGWENVSYVVLLCSRERDGRSNTLTQEQGAWEAQNKIFINRRKRARYTAEMSRWYRLQLSPGL